MSQLLTGSFFLKYIWTRFLPSTISGGRYNKMRCQTSSLWNRVRPQIVPRSSLEQSRSGRVSMMYCRSTWPFCWGGGLRMVEGLFGIQPYHSNWNAKVYYYPEFSLTLFNALADDMKVCYLTCPKLRAECCAEAVNITAVRYSANSTWVFRDFGKSVNSGNMHLPCVPLKVTRYKDG